MGCKVEDIDTEKYQFLKVCGGEIESFTMVKDTRILFPNIKYKQGISKITTSIYLMKKDRNIVISDN